MAWSGYSESGQGSQERGPRSFANDIGPATVAQGRPGGAAGNSASGGVRFIGSGTQLGNPKLADTRPPAAVSVEDKTFGLLMQLAEKQMAPHIAKAKQNAEMEGAVRHAQGVALEEIINEQPWYATIFGTAPAVEGAVAYASSAAVSKFTANALARMDELAITPPDQIGGVLSEMMEGHMTGNGMADGIIKANLVNQLPGLIKQHTRAHVERTQKDANEAHYQSIVAGGDRYQQVMKKSDQYSEQDLAVAGAELASVIALPQGRNPETHWANVGKALTEHAARGNLHVVRAALDADVLDAMPDAVRGQIEGNVRKVAPKAFAQALAEDDNLLKVWAKVATDENMTDDEVIEAYRFMNNVMEMKTGVPQSLLSYFDGEDMMKRIGMAYDDQARVAARTARSALGTEAERKAIMKESAYKAMDEFVAGKFDPTEDLNMQLINLTAKFGLTEKEREDWAESRLSGMPLPAMAAFADKFPAVKFDAVKVRVDGALGFVKNPTQDVALRAEKMEQLATLYANFKNPTSRVTHLSAESVEEIEAYVAARDQVGPLGAIVTMVDTRKTRGEAHKLFAQKAGFEVEVRDTIIDALMSRGTTGLVMRDKPSESSLQFATQLVKEQVMDRGIAPKNIAASLVSNPALSVGGGMILFNSDPETAREKPLSQVLGAGSDDMHLANIRTLSAERVQALGGDASDTFIARIENQGDTGFMVQYTTHDQKIGTLILTSAELRQYNLSRLQRQPGDTARPGDPEYRNTGIRGGAAPYVPTTP